MAALRVLVVDDKGASGLLLRVQLAVESSLHRHVQMPRLADHRTARGSAG